jgi:hypothetical protein
MENKNTIQEELTTISPLLAALPKANVYTAPDNYFEDFTTSIITLVSTTGFMDDVAKYNPSMQVPVAYFDQLAATILKKINIQQQTILHSDEAELSKQLKDLRSYNVYETPVNYFANFPAILLQKINAFEDDATIEINIISPMLASLERTNVLEAPAGYFDHLPNLVLQNSKPVSKVVAMQKRNLFVRYAAAALLIGAISVAVVKFTNKPSEINGQYASIETSIEKGIKMDNTKFDETLNNLTEEDIATYLQKNGTEADLALLTSSIEDGNVPSEDDYLTDEKTLEKFLKEIDTKKLNN